jgi:hypothetical protein
VVAEPGFLSFRHFFRAETFLDRPAEFVLKTEFDLWGIRWLQADGA